MTFLFNSFSADSLIMWGGILIIIAAVYIETGLLLGLLVPGGETLLFSAGLLNATGYLELNIILLIGICIAAAIAGDNTGYYIGLKSGHRIYNWKENFFYKKKYLHKAEKFYKNHSIWATTFGRFLPVIRTFNPLLSGATDLSWKKFFKFSTIGVIIYVSSLILLGYFVGIKFPEVGNYLEFILLTVVVLIFIPIIRQIIKDNF